MEDAILSEEERAAISKARCVSVDVDGAHILFETVILVARQIDFMFDIYW